MELVRWSKNVFILRDAIGDEYQIRWATGKSSRGQPCTILQPALAELIAKVGKA